MKRTIRRFCALILIYAAVFLVCVGAMGVLTCFFPFSTWFMSGLAIWLILCCGSLCIPDEIWERLLSK